MVTKKSNSGKKKKIQTTAEVAKVAKISEEAKKKKKAMDKMSFLWLTMAIMYFGFMILSWQFDPETMAFTISNTLGYVALVIWGGLLYTSSKNYGGANTGRWYRITGVVLMTLGLFEIVQIFL